MSMQQLEPLVGEWTVEIAHAQGTFRGRTVFEWLQGRSFLIQRTDVPQPFPSSIAIIGRDESGQRFIQHYFDARGVARVYQMSLAEGIWKLWRDGPDFAQRFSGTFAADGDTIEGAWELRRPGSTWQHDFTLTLRRSA